MTITFALSHQIISRMDSMILASGSKNYVTAKFDLLTEDWTAPITAIFDSYTVVLDEDNQCLVPWEVLANPGKVVVSAFCGDLHTATSVLVPVHPGGYIDGQTPQPPTPDVYAQLAGMVKTAVDTANDVKDRADAGEFNGKDAPQIDDTQASPDYPWSGAKVDTELGKYAPLESALTVSGIGSDMASLSPTIAWKMQGLKLFGRTTQDGTPIPNAPVLVVSTGDGGSVDVKVIGKNLFPNGYESGSSNGISFDANPDGSYHVHGTATALAQFLTAGKEKRRFPFDETLTISGSSSPDVRVMLWGYKTNETSSFVANVHSAGTPTSFKRPDFKYGTCVIEVSAGKTVDTIVYPMLEVSSSVTQYEPYTDQDMTVYTTNGLPGLPVSSGGNYIDSTGQQWICDEIDFVRGAYVQRLRKRELTGQEGFVLGSDSISYYVDYYKNGNPESYPAASVLPGICSHYKYVPSDNRTEGYNYYHLGYGEYLYRHMFTDESVSSVSEFKTKLNDLYTAGNPVIVFDLLANPVETALTKEDLKAYAALTSYNGTTNVAAQGCGVGATALANPNAYIKGLIQRIAALEQNAIGG